MKKERIKEFHEFVKRRSKNLLTRKSLENIRPKDYEISIKLSEQAEQDFYLGYSPFEDIGAEIFLYGVCHIFAQALHDKFGYEMMRGIDTEDHFFCQKEYYEKVYYIDVQGATTDKESFFRRFPRLNPNNLESYKGWRPNENEPKELYDFALAILNDEHYRKNYIV